MRSSSIPSELSRLITEGGFREESDILSFAMALGVFNEMKGDTSIIEVGTDVGGLSIYPVCALIVDDGDPGALTIEEMSRELEAFLSGGIEMMIERIKGKSDIDALKEIAGMIPL